MTPETSRSSIYLTSLCREVKAEECSFWGDEFVGIQEELYGSDSFMLTHKTEAGDFFDVSSLEGVRHDKIQVLGGGVSKFIQFLIEQGK